ncbi:MAG: FAD:protein FMN transferase [Clostridiales bacterium]|nr:FAD:protein FMN transferase [Clostridiales bacterium]
MSILYVLFFLGNCLTACQKKIPSQSLQIFALDTFITLSADGNEAEEAVKAASSSLTALEKRLSRHIEGSEIDNLNHSSFGSPVTLSDDVYALLSKTLDMASKTDGIFDPTVGALMDVWGWNKDPDRIPQQDRIDEALSTLDYSRIHLLDDHQAYVDEGTIVDLGGVAKGYIADALMQQMKKYDVVRIILDLGGNICGWAKDRAIKVGVRSPKEESAMIAIVSVQEGSVITSGAYERYFEVDGKRYGHIMDTRTGYPVESDMLSVTVITEDGTLGDILSTTLFACGKEEAMELSEQLGVHCILCMQDGTLLVSEELKGSVDAQQGWTIQYFG